MLSSCWDNKQLLPPAQRSEENVLGAPNQTLLARECYLGEGRAGVSQGSANNVDSVDRDSEVRTCPRSHNRTQPHSLDYLWCQLTRKLRAQPGLLSPPDG